jgi:hypothetical protein
MTEAEHNAIEAAFLERYGTDQQAEAEAQRNAGPEYWLGLLAILEKATEKERQEHGSGKPETVG